MASASFAGMRASSSRPSLARATEVEMRGLVDLDCWRNWGTASSSWLKTLAELHGLPTIDRSVARAEPEGIQLTFTFLDKQQVFAEIDPGAPRNLGV